MDTLAALQSFGSIKIQGHDEISIDFLQNVASAIVKPITMVINCCFTAEYEGSNHYSIAQEWHAQIIFSFHLLVVENIAHNQVFPYF